MRVAVACVLSALGAVVCAGARAQDAGVREEAPLPERNRPRLQVDLRPRTGLVTGDVLKLVIVADALEGDDVAVPSQSFGPFEVHAKRARAEPVLRSRHRFVFELELLALEPGDHELPPIELRVVTADGHIGTVETEAQAVRVGSVLGNEPNATPKPPPRPVRVMEKNYTLLWIGCALAALGLTALVTLLLARWWRRREKPALPPPPPRPPGEVAMEKLNALRLGKLRALEEGRVVAWVDALSDVVREYLGGRYDFDGLESTTDEVMARLRARGSSTHDIALLLGDCDLVKFAKAMPGDAECEALLHGAFQVVRQTMAYAPTVPGAVP